MNRQPTFNLLVIDPSTPQQTRPLLDYLDKLPLSLHVANELSTPPLSQKDAVVLYGPVEEKGWETLGRYVQQGGILLGIHETAEESKTKGAPALFGARPCEPITRSEVRVLPTDPLNRACDRLGDAFYMSGLFQPLDLTAEDTDTLFYADWRYTHKPMLTRRVVGDGVALLTTLHDWENQTFQRLIYRILKTEIHPEQAKQTLGIGLLGYAPSVGQLHGTGAATTQGLTLNMACDLSPDRLEAARTHFPDIITTKDSNDLINSPDIDIVIIATAPSSHAKLAMQMLEGGKHVICEKPLALSTAEADAMRALAEQNGLHLSCHQNRRWDSDFLSIQNAIESGWLGEIYSLETFIGGYGHPCGYWHSEEKISGGTTFDWGAHYLDWMLALIPEKIVGVIGTRQNRAWHDITNADQERIQLRYANGAEAEFTHSDLAFIPKPKWYVGGTEGTIVGHWRKVDAYEVDPVVYFHKHEIPPAELGADIELRRKTDAGIFTQSLPEIPHRPFPFHANLADHLLLGEPLTVPVAHSARVVAILETAKRSAENGGRLEEVEI